MTNKLKICILTTSYPRYEGDDTSVFIRDFAENLAEKVGEILVVVPAQRGASRYKIEKNNLKIIEVNYGFLAKNNLIENEGFLPTLERFPWRAMNIPFLLLKLFLTLYRLRGRYDFILAQWSFAGLVAFFLKVICGKKYFSYMRGSDFPLLRFRFYRYIVAAIFSQASGITAVSRHILDKLLELYPKYSNKFCELPFGIPYMATLPRREKKDNQIKLLMVARVIPLKKIETVIAALEFVTDASLDICGKVLPSKYFNSLQQLIALKKLSERVKFCGVLTRVELAIKMSQADFLISASSSEGRPNNVLEAMLCHLPVIASNIPAHHEVIQDKINGFLFKLDNSKELSEVINLSAKDHPLCKAIANAAYSYASQYRWENVIEKHLLFLRAAS
jgi:glycosyltransferase involved in cell wall biosynthesis